MDSPDPAMAGNDITYLVAVINNGPSDATGVLVSDTLPTGVTLKSATQSQGSYNSSTNIWSIGSLARGTGATLTLVVTINSNTLPGTIINTATVSGNQTDPNTENNTTTQQTTVNTRSDLVITKTASQDTITAGNDMTYTLTITNNGPSNATGVTATDVLISGVTFKSATTSQGSYSSVTGIWYVGNLANGASATLTLLVKINSNLPSGTITNSASVSGNQTDPNTNNNIIIQHTTVNGRTPTDLAITKADSPDPAIAGNDLIYTLTVVNYGPVDAFEVIVNDTIPADVTFKSATPSQGSFESDTGIWFIGNLPLGANATLTLVVTVNSNTAPGIISNTATVSDGLIDPDAGNNTVIEPTTIETWTDLSITKVDDVDPVTIGNYITYEITVTNHGPSSATDVVVNDILPAGVTFKSATPAQGSYDSENGVWNVGNLPKGVSIKLALKVITNLSNEPGTVLTNIAVVSGGQYDPDQANNTATQETGLSEQAVRVPTISLWGGITLILLLCCAIVLVLRRRLVNREDSLDL